ncbi:hypothetical protein T4D_1285 [Trichinella pseudospiralis]|uniref:Uncharacterized protein n=1 Tax=Trichinella pseudospiralis TaxID=6337 RepID=A0A0V1FGA2_TRIPS|nr:hypothetical protein T4D_1285 [Trichinella pseudospiralis]
MHGIQLMIAVAAWSSVDNGKIFLLITVLSCCHRTKAVAQTWLLVVVAVVVNEMANFIMIIQTHTYTYTYRHRIIENQPPPAICKPDCVTALPNFYIEKNEEAKEKNY